MKFTIKKAIGMSVGALLMGMSTAHPGLSDEQKTAPCPFQEQQQYQLRRRLGEGWQEPPMRALGREGDGGVPEGGFASVKEDLMELMTDSQQYWPADDGHYGGFFIRLAWHCSGSYRRSDGRGGCDGGRIRYDPELNWPDNANLDKALRLLRPIKEKYGEKLSWGDLIILAGTTAVESMGGPVLGFCGGRIDDANGDDSLKLGPSPEQEEIGPCVSEGLQGKCLNYEGTALGTGTVGLIYVNPGGPVGHEGKPMASGEDIHRVFSTGMSFNERETVAIIGGGHAFGKAHGACPNPPCGSGSNKGKGENTFTSGFEGAWTTDPAKWDNEFFTSLFDYDWELITGPGGNGQWIPTNKTDGSAGPDIMMLTSDIALSVDPTYKEIALEYAADVEVLNSDFAAAFYKLMTMDMGPSVRCIGDLLPAEPQPFQNDLPPGPMELPDFVPIRASIEELLEEDSNNSDAFINLAYQCASTYRESDHTGGCNGARIRHFPENEWPENAGTQDALATLEKVKEAHSDVSYADLIVLAGMTALKHENDELDLPFCGGAVDAETGVVSKDLSPRKYNDPLITVLDDFLVKGLTQEEGVALASRKNVGSQYYEDLLAEEVDFSEEELALLKDEKLKKIVEKYARKEDELLEMFSAAWTKMMTADRFLNNRENACAGVSTPTTAASLSESDPSDD